MKLYFSPFCFTIFNYKIKLLQQKLEHYLPLILMSLTIAISIFFFVYYYNSQMGLAYNDARSHLNIGRRVVEGLKPGIAQLGSVWLPLTHALMIPTIWNDFMWHSGLAGAMWSMIAYVSTCWLIYQILAKLKVGVAGRIVGVLVFATNLNIIYLQSTAMTELLLIATMTAGVYELINFHKEETILHLVKSAFWIMLSTLIRYDGWFLFFYSAMLIVLYAFRKQKWSFWSSFKMAEGMFILFCTLGGFGIFLWVLWNLMIFGDPLYFAFGPYSAHAQQSQLETAGVLVTKRDLIMSLRTYWYAMVYNSGILHILMSGVGAIFLFLDKKIPKSIRIASTALFAPLIFNILALYLGHSVLFVQNLNGETWFNVRYGIMMMPSIAIFIGYLVYRFSNYKYLIIGLLVLVNIFAFLNNDAVTIDDGRVGSSQKNVSEVSGWLQSNVTNEPGFILISAASHDAIIFSTGLPMKRFIHEGTGLYWDNAVAAPDRWARWIVMRTHDENDQTFKLVNQSQALHKYTLVSQYPFADIYELKPEYLDQLNTEANLGQQK